MKRLLECAVLLGLLICASPIPAASPADAQTVQQSGSVTANHIATWATNGVIKDGGAVTANDSLSGGSTTSITSGQTFYCSPAGCATSAAIAALVPFTGTAVNLNAAVATAPGAGQTIVATLMTGPYGSLTASAATCTISASATSCSDTTHQVNVPAGQAWAIRLVSSGSAASTGGETFGLQFISGTPPQPTTPYVLQSGNITSGHAVGWITNGVIGDAGVPVNNTIAPGPFVSGDIVYVNSLLQLASSGVQLSTVVIGPASAVSGNVASFNGSSGKLLQDSGVLASSIVAGPGIAVSGNLVSFNGSGGRLIQDSGIASTTTGSGSVVLQTSPSLLGVPVAPTAAPGTNTTQIATTSFVAASFAPLASPALTGTPTSPTAANGTNTTQIATTAFVQNAIAAQCPTAGAILVGIGGSSAQCSNLAFTGGLLVTLNAQAGTFAGLIAQDGGTSKWAVGKKSDSTFQIRDLVNSVDIVNAAPGGPVAIVASSTAVCDANTLLATVARFCDGSNASPVTTNLSVAISRVDARLTGGSGPDATLWVNTVGTSAQTAGVNGIFSQLVQNGTFDSVAIIGLAQFSGANSSAHSSFGAYLEGNKTTTGNGAFVLQASLDNTAADDTWSSSSTLTYPVSIGLDIVCGGGAQLVGTKNCTAAYTTRSGGATTKFDVGLGFRPSSIVSTSIEDDSASVTVLKITGAHTTGIDANTGSFSGNFLVCPSGACSLTGPGVFTTVGNINSTSTDRVVLVNTTAATSGQAQWSPRERWTGFGFNATSSIELDTIAEQQVTANNSVNAAPLFAISQQVNAGGYQQVLLLSYNSNSGNTSAILVSPSGKNANMEWQDGITVEWYLQNLGGSSDALALLNSATTQVLRIFQSGAVNIGTSATDPGAAGILNLGTGLRIANAAANNHVLVGNGTNYVDAANLGVASGGTNCTSASITCFNNITGFSAAGTTGTTSTNLVFSTSPTLATPTFTTSATVPLIAGGSAAGSTLTLESTSGAGTTDSIIFQTASQLQRMIITTGGIVGVGSITPSATTFNVSANATAVAGNPTVVNATGSALNSIVNIVGANAASPVINVFSFGTAVQAGIWALAARGTAASPTTAVTGDGAFVFNAFAYDGTNYDLIAQIGVFAKTMVANTSASGEIRFLGVSGNSVNIAMFVQPSGGITIDVTDTHDPGANGLYIAAQQFMPNITTSSAAQTGTVCWTTGTGKFTVDTTVGCLTSLEEAKDILATLDPRDALRIVDDLRPFSFRYRPGWGDSGHYEQFGLGAHQTATVDERLVGRDPEGTLQGVRYMELTAVLVGAIRELKADNDNLRTANDNLTEKVNRLEARLWNTAR